MISALKLLHQQHLCVHAEEEQNDGAGLGRGDACVPHRGRHGERAAQRLQFLHLPCQPRDLGRCALYPGVSLSQAQGFPASLAPVKVIGTSPTTFHSRDQKKDLGIAMAEGSSA